MTDLDELERLAKAAGEETWSTESGVGKFDGAYVWYEDGDSVCRVFSNLGHMPEPVMEEDLAEFIAAANPAMILSLIAEVRQLRRFAGLVFRAHRNDGYPGDVDGSEIQQWALECGLVAERQMTEPCSEHCTCAEVCDWPITCYFNTALGNAVRDIARTPKDPT